MKSEDLICLFIVCTAFLCVGNCSYVRERKCIKKFDKPICSSKEPLLYQESSRPLGKSPFEILLDKCGCQVPKGPVVPFQVPSVVENLVTLVNQGPCKESIAPSCECEPEVIEVHHPVVTKIQSSQIVVQEDCDHVPAVEIVDQLCSQPVCDQQPVTVYRQPAVCDQHPMTVYRQPVCEQHPVIIQSQPGFDQHPTPVFNQRHLAPVFSSESCSTPLDHRTYSVIQQGPYYNYQSRQEVMPSRSNSVRYHYNQPEFISTPIETRHYPVDYVSSDYHSKLYDPYFYPERDVVYGRASHPQLNSRPFWGDQDSYNH